MKKIAVKYFFMTVTLLCVLSMIFLIYSKEEYRILHIIDEKLIVKAGVCTNNKNGDYVCERQNNYLFDVNNETFLVYTGSFNENVLIENQKYTQKKQIGQYFNIEYNENTYNKNCYIKNNKPYCNGKEVLSIISFNTQKYKIWTKNGKYLVFTDYGRLRKWGIWSTMGTRSIFILNLETGEFQQNSLFDKSNPKYHIIDIVGIL